MLFTWINGYKSNELRQTIFWESRIISEKKMQMVNLSDWHCFRRNLASENNWYDFDDFLKEIF